MGSSSKTAEPPKAVPAPSNTAPYGQTSTQAIPWTNNLPNPATGDPLRPARLGDPTWQSGTQIPATAPAAAPPPQDIDALKALLAALMNGSGGGEFYPDYFGSSNGGGGIGGNYTTSGGDNYGGSSSSYGSAAGQAGGKGKGLY
jgi:hypothetical protein